jgi:hypothetical protein
MYLSLQQLLSQLITLWLLAAVLVVEIKVHQQKQAAAEVVQAVIELAPCLHYPDLLL